MIQLPALINQLADKDIENVLEVLIELYYDLYILKAIQQSKHNPEPGEILSAEEAKNFLETYQE